MKKNDILRKDVMVGVAFILVVVLFLSFMVDKDTETIVLSDSCGIMPGGQGVSHTIRDADDCRVQCRGQCRAQEMEYAGSVFNSTNEFSCYTCYCDCFI